MKFADSIRVVAPFFLWPRQVWAFFRPEVTFSEPSISLQQSNFLDCGCRGTEA
jgi:hypothetical protein